jgi:glutathione S-transferase
MFTYKVYYFHGNGRAASIRAMLTYTNAKWENIKLSDEEFEAMREAGKLEYKQLPVLEVDGKWFSQSAAIEIYLARIFNLLGDTAEDEYHILNLLGTREDLSKVHTPIFFPSSEEQKAKRDEIIKQFKEVSLPYMLEAWEKKYIALHGKYLLGDKFTLADIFITCYCELLFLMDSSKEIGIDSLLTKYAPKLAAHTEKIKNNELANYFKNVFTYEGVVG